MAEAIITSGPNLWHANVFSYTKCAHTVARVHLLIFTDRKLHILSRPAETDAPQWPSVEDVTEDGKTSAAPGTTDVTTKSGNSNILAYVSVLAAVVLGLLIYVAYKW